MNLGLWIEAADTLKLFKKMKEPSESVQALMKALGFSLKWKELADKTTEEGGEVPAEKAKSAVAFLETTLAKCRIIVSQAKANKRERNAEKRDAKSAGKALESLVGMPYVAAPVLSTVTTRKVYHHKQHDAQVKEKAGISPYGWHYWDHPIVETRNVSMNLLTALLAHFQEGKSAEEAATLAKAFLMLGGTVERPSVQYAGGEHVEMTPPIDASEQRSTSINSWLASKNYKVFGGQSGAAKFAILFPSKKNKGDFKPHHWLAKLAVEWFPQAGSASGYIGRLNAALKMPALKDLPVEFYDETKETERVCGTDGANHGWNVDHPVWKGLVEGATDGLPCIQGTYATTAIEGLILADGTKVGVFAKGQWLPWRGGANGPALRIGLRNVKGGAKLAIKAKLLKSGSRIHGEPAAVVDAAMNNGGYFQGCSSWFGVMSIKNDSKTQKLGAQWISHLAVTPRNVEVITKLAKKAASDFCKTTVEQRLEKLASQDAEFGVQLDFARALGFEPGVIPDIRNRMLRHYKSSLYDTFASVGVKGDIWTVVMTTRVEEGTVQFAPHGKRAYSNVGYKGDVVVWRSPHGHHQANVSFRVAELAAELYVDPTQPLDTLIECGEGLKARNYPAMTIFMHPNDAARINGDDDGDDVAVSTMPELLELVKIQREVKGSAVWSYEPTSHASGRGYLEDPDDWGKQLLHRAQGQTGRFANALQDLQSLQNNGLSRWEGMANAFSAGLQMSIDGLKKDASMAPYEVVKDLSKWLVTQAEDGRVVAMAMPRANGEVDGMKISPADFTKAAFDHLDELKAWIFADAASMSYKELQAANDALKASAPTGAKGLPKFGATSNAPQAAKMTQAAKIWAGKKRGAVPCSPWFRAMYGGEEGSPRQPKKKGVVDFASWRWGGSDCQKDEVNPTQWVKTSDKDFGFAYWYERWAKTTLPPTLLHAAHDAARETFMAEGQESVSWFKKEVKRDFTSFATYYSKIISCVTDGAVDVRNKPDTVGRPVNRGGKNEEGLTYLESRFAAVVKEYTAMLESATSANDASGGSDDNGKAAVEAVATFRRWVTGSEPRGWVPGKEPSEVCKGVLQDPRPLTVQELVFLGVYWENGYISPAWKRTAVKDNESGADKAKRLELEAVAKSVRGLTGWGMICNGSPLVKEAGVKDRVCQALPSAAVVDYLEAIVNYAGEIDSWPVGVDGKKLEIKQALKAPALLHDIFDELDEAHWKETGGDVEGGVEGERLVHCPHCAIRAKMAIANRMRDEGAFELYRSIANQAWKDNAIELNYAFIGEDGLEVVDFQALAEDQGKFLNAVYSAKGDYWYFLYGPKKSGGTNASRPSAMPSKEESYDGGAMPPEPPPIE